MNVATGTASATFGRRTDDLGLAPGAYPARLEVTISRDGQLTEKTVETDLLIYDQKRRPRRVVFAARISGQPLADAQGRFVADPARFTRARDDVTRLAERVIGDPKARLSLAVSPLLLNEWARIADGYQLAGPEGIETIAADSATPRLYAAALASLREAVATDRLELTALGFSDPDIAELAANGLVADVDTQYAQGISAVFASLEATPSTGTVPAGGCLPPSAISSLVREGVGYAVVEPDCVRSKKATATPGAYRVANQPLTVLVSDDQLSQATALSGETRQLHLYFKRFSAGGSNQPIVVRADVGPQAMDADGLVAAMAAVEAQPWLRLELANASAGRRPSAAVRLRVPSGSDEVPPGYFSEVKTARRWAKALAAALGSSDSPQAAGAEMNSLVAQSAAWAGPMGDWVFADRGLGFANAARQSAEKVLDPIGLRAQPITLAGTTGRMPVTLINDSDQVLNVDVTARGDGAARVEGPARTAMELNPGENLIELQVSLPNALSGKVTVAVSSAGLVLEQQSVRVSASYLDRLVIIGAVILLMVVMLVFIIRKVRTSEAGTSRPVRHDRTAPADDESGEA
jgi:hypothetical protein